MSNLKVYKVQFYADLGKLCIKTPITCTITASWKRSAEVAKSSTIDFVNGQANFNETITIPVNMYYEESNYTFQEKKSLFSFTLHTPKGQKTAGTVTVDLASMLNNKLDCYEENYKLEKCPDKEAKMFIRVRAELIGEQSSDNLSSISGISGNMSGLGLDGSLLSKSDLANPFASIGNQSNKSASKEKEIPTELEALRKEIQEVNAEKATLAQQLECAKASINPLMNLDGGQGEEGDATLRNEVIKLTQQVSMLTGELQKSKMIQQKLEKQINQQKVQQQEYLKELQANRVRLQNVCSHLLNALTPYL